DILVSTSVVEVGVDIPNATVMMVENAERFGLAQLHQFRGRVGRSDKQSYCMLFSESRSEAAMKRLSFMENTFSGFKLAEMDLELRGPGQMYGGEQSGFWDFHFAEISDKVLIERATTAAKKITEDGLSKYPALKEKLAESQMVVHPE
ncbi:MAG: ATP-dependent DNA helicase RecG, partial [Candidatus Berkelbacteria bacterium Athens1014_28]